MIVYQKSFDLYHTVYRMMQLLTYFKRGEYVEIDRLRIWDFYLLHPNKMIDMRFKMEDKDIKSYINKFITRKDNLYEKTLDNRKIFNKIKPYQMTALKCLASYEIINKDFLAKDSITPISKGLVKILPPDFLVTSIQEENTIKLLTSHFYLMPLNGENGLKNRTNLLESRYDA